MKKAILLFCLLGLGFSGEALAQEIPADSASLFNPPRNSVYGEFLGNGLFGSLNYERFFRMPITNEPAAFRIGAFLVPEGSRQYGNAFRRNYLLSLPLELIFIAEKPWRLGRGNLRPEWGPGMTIYKEYVVHSRKDGSSTTFSETYIMPSFRFGCKWQPAGKAFFLKASITSLLIFDPFFPFPILPVPGLAYGYTFGR